MNRRRLFRLTAAGFVLTDMLWRLFHDTRPIDALILAVDFLVLLAILWFEIREERRRGKEAKKASLRDEQVAKRREQIFLCLGKGQELIRAAPPRFPTDGDVNKAYTDGREWGKLVAAWIYQTSQSLEAFSSLADAAFLDDSGINTAVYPDIDGSGHIQHLYSVLNQKMTRLRSIGEKPDTYF